MDLTYFYPQSQQALFTDREYYLSLLDLTRQALLAGHTQHLAFLSPRRIGKTNQPPAKTWRPSGPNASACPRDGRNASGSSPVPVFATQPSATRAKRAWRSAANRIYRGGIERCRAVG